MKTISKKKILFYIFGFIFTLVPLISSILFCLKDCHFLTEVYIPLGGWSDEIHYYTQVSAMLEDIIPNGFFGYNQSRADFGPFALWGPMPIIPYALYGFVFGWNYLSPVFANILFMCLMFLCVYCINKPNPVNSVMLACAYLLYPILNRHIVSGVAEAVYIFGVVIIFSVAKELFDNEELSDKRRIIYYVILLFLAVYLTLARGYYAVLFLIPFAYSFVKKEKKGMLISGVICILSFVTFLLMHEYICAPYFMDEIGVNDSGIIDLIKIFLYSVEYILKSIWYSLRYHDGMTGWCYLMYILTLACIMIFTSYDYFHKKKKVYFKLCIIISESVLLLAMMTLYSVEAGARHLLALSFANMVIMVLENQRWLSTLCIIVAFSQLFLMGNKEPIPYIDRAYDEYLSTVGRDFDTYCKVTDELSYDNTMAMPTADYKDDGSPVCTYYGLMFALPEGMAVSLDEYSYYDNPDNLKAGYILCHPQGQIRHILEQNGYENVCERQEYMIFKRKQ